MVEIIVGLAISNTGSWSRKWWVLRDIIGKATKRTHVAHTPCEKKSCLFFPACMCNLGILSMGFLRGNLCVRARYPIIGMLGITARRLARDMQEAVFEDFDSMRSPRSVSVRNMSMVQHMAAEPGSAAKC